MELTKEMQEALEDPGVRYEVKDLIRRNIQRDPVDVLEDLELALRLFEGVTL